ncbi:MAG: hypothetical protein HON94_01245 [Methylococcales bacterium]|jgi:hypothetical protein|nr:hypothetical protein [Methylococcales bacterium]MBT7410635.1 hypothetical protein [Methylococcales bacterium]
MKKIFIIIVIALLPVELLLAHHVLGRPAYSLNEDSNTPPSMQVETQIGNYFINYMVYPAFPKPNEPGRINLYASRLDNDAPFTGEVTFTVRDDSWFNQDEEPLGKQPVDDNVFRQGFVFAKDGNYVITASFKAEGEPYIIEFPLRIGNPAPIGPLGIAFGLIALILVTVSVIQRKRLGRLKVRQAQQDINV